MRRMTYGERMDLAIKLWNWFTALGLLGFILLIIGGVVGKGESLAPMIPGAVCVTLAVIFAEVSIRIRYHEENTPNGFGSGGR